MAGLRTDYSSSISLLSDSLTKFLIEMLTNNKWILPYISFYRISAFKEIIKNITYITSGRSSYEFWLDCNQVGIHKTAGIKVWCPAVW